MYKIILILVFLGITCNGDSTDNDWKNQGFYRPRRNYPENQPQTSYSENNQNTQPIGYQNAQRQSFGSSYNQNPSPQNAFNTQKAQDAFGWGFNSFQNQYAQNGFNQANSQTFTQKPQNHNFANSNAQKQYQTGFNQANSQTLSQRPQNQNFGFSSNSQSQNIGSSFSQNTLKNPFSNYNQNSQTTFGTSFGQQKQPFASSVDQAFPYQNAGSNFGQKVFKGPEYLPPREPTLPPFTARTYLPPKEVPKTTTRRPFTTTRRPYTAPTYLPPEEIPKTTRRPFTTTRRPYTTTYRPYTTTYRFTTRHYNGTTLIPEYRTTTKKTFYTTTTSTTRKFYVIPTSTPLKKVPPGSVSPAMAMLVPPEPEDGPVRPNRTKIGTVFVSPAMAIPVPPEPEDDPTTTTTTTTPSTTTSSTTPSTTTTTSTTPSTTTTTTTSTTPSTTTSTTTTPSTTTSTTTTTPSTTTSISTTTPSTTTSITTPSTTISSTTPSTTTRLTPTIPDLNRFQEEETISTMSTTKRITTTTTPKHYQGPWYLPPEDDPTPPPTTPTITTTTTTTTPRTTTTTPEPIVSTPENDCFLIEDQTTTTKKRCGPCRNRTTPKPKYPRPPTAPAMAMPVPPEAEEDPTPGPTISTTTTTTTPSTTTSTTTPSTTTSTTTMSTTTTTPSTTTSTTTPSTTTSTTTTTPSTTTSTTTTTTTPSTTTSTTTPEPTTLTLIDLYKDPAYLLLKGLASVPLKPALAKPVPPECDPDDPTTYPSGINEKSSDPCGTSLTPENTSTTKKPDEDPTTPNRDRFLIEEKTITPPLFRGPQYLPPDTPICVPEVKERVSRSAKTLELGEVTGARPVWHVGIYKKTTVPYMQICGGSVVRQDVVISAAHCFWSDFGPDAAENYAVGANKLYKPYGEVMDKRAQKSDVKQIILPPRYRGSLTSFQDDLAILKLATPFTYAKGLRPVCVDFDDDFDEQQLSEGNQGTIAGWGYTDSEGSRTQYLLWLELPYVGVETCIQRNEGFVRYITSDKICAGEFNTGKALCKGDSGGGLVFWHGEPNNAVPYLRGIASTAPSADNLKCNVLAVGSFTRINSHRRFLRKHVPEIDKECRYWDW